MAGPGQEVFFSLVLTSLYLLATAVKRDGVYENDLDKNRVAELIFLAYEIP